jgi:hypothetical protein
MERVKSPDTIKNMEELLCPTACFGQHRPLRNITLDCCYIVLEPRFNIDMMMVITVIVYGKYKLPSCTWLRVHLRPLTTH